MDRVYVVMVGDEDYVGAGVQYYMWSDAFTDADKAREWVDREQLYGGHGEDTVFNIVELGVK